MGKDNILATVRVRPLLPQEAGEELNVEAPGSKNQITISDQKTGEKKKFNLNYCFWSMPNDKNKEIDDNNKVYKKLGESCIKNVEEGYNSTIFAYGQTGSGKSFSVEGSESDKGILQRLCERIFQYRDDIEKTDGNEVDIDVSYLEIYNESLRDLLDATDKKLKIIPMKKEVVVKNLLRVPIESYEEVNELFQEGKKIRVVGSTSMNKQSSRSHAVFTLYVVTRLKDSKNDKVTVKKSKIHLVDLAGSERASKTQAKGARLKEGSNINKSLTFLGLVIEKLSKKGQDKHVPYRNSELTKLLSHSLGGNSRTIMIAAVSPAASNYQETKSTLLFAERCSSISNKTLADVEEEDKAAEDDEDDYKAQIAKLEAAIEKRRKEVNGDMSDKKLKELITERDKLVAELQEIMEVMGTEKESKEDKMVKKRQMEEDRKKLLNDAGFGAEDQKGIDPDTPYLSNVTDDPSLIGTIKVYFLNGSYNIGSERPCSILIKGLGINSTH
jgi:kinesin family member 13